MPAWQLSWPKLWRDRWRWLARRWGFALAGFAAGLLGVGSWQHKDLEALWESQAQVDDLQKKLQEHLQQAQSKQTLVAAPALTPQTGPPLVKAGWPVQGTQAAVWLQLERLVVQHGLRWMSLQLESPSTMGHWPSQTAALRLQGRFEDWVRVWAAMNARGPLWGMERLRITPQEGGVAVDAVLRLWLSPGPVQANVSTELMQVDGPVVLRVGAGAPVFVPTASLPASASVVSAGLNDEVLGSVSAGISTRSGTLAPDSQAAASTMGSLSPDPADWPLAQVRLAGVWQSGPSAQPILQAGPHWVPARVGQRIGPHGHVVHSIHAEDVHLRTAQGAVWVIGLEKAKP
ncbi:hypothetical protein [Limnohabitans sp. 63ED37-2]|uniref:hypothetical protein n=1 Tax=Limnohabitans sp. 63ED37-2 TaxID=1678128 RepID=UPI000783BBEA|nr:hypothetical protein [Limnohabitans sp. 63ED37-2]